MAKGLNARKVETAGPGRYGDGDGLWLVVVPSKAKKWVYRFSFGGKVTEMGLGPFKDLSLEKAREARDVQRRILKSGLNPIAVRRASEKRGQGADTFGAQADEFIKSKSETSSLQD